MVQTCCIKSCKERQNRDTNISFHKFPKDPQLREKWIEAINCENFELSAHSRVCSKHFRSECFVGTSLSSRRNLTDGAVPCVSEVPEVPDMQAMELVNVPSIETEGESTSLNNEFNNEDNDFESAEFQEIPPKRIRISYIGDFLKSGVITDQETFKHLVAKTLAEKKKPIKAF